MSNTASSFCPYKGLQPYTSDDRAYFFGRERDQEIISANLYAAPLTVLYGASGVGKSSVLLAGVVPKLKQAPRIATVVFRDWQDASFMSALKTCVLREVSRSAGKEVSVDASLPFDDFLVESARAFRGTIFFIFDQFEEYFLYHSEKASGEEFDAQFARSVNRKEITANFLVSMREDGLSKLDRFQGRIPHLLSNMLRLEHLDRASAIQAIIKPLDKYNEGVSDEQKVTIEDELVDALLNDLSEAAQASAATAARPEPRIETPLLQIMLTRLWDEEMEAGSRVLRSSTLTRLGRAEQIIRTHLDKVIDKLSESERDAAARLFRHLVTPSGAKIALMPSDLAFFAKLPEDQIKQTLNKLSSAEVRILRPVAPPPDKPTTLRYEIFHDVLAEAILDWCTRYETAQQRAQAEKALEHERRRSSRLKKTIAGLALLVFVAAAATVIAVVQRARVERARADAMIANNQLENQKKQNQQLIDILKLLSSEDLAQVNQGTAVMEQLGKDNPAVLEEIIPAINIILEEKSKAKADNSASKEATQQALRVFAQVVDSNPDAEKYLADDTHLPTKIFIQYQDDQQLSTAFNIRNRLQLKGFLVHRIEKRPDVVLPQNELRYFSDEEIDRAKISVEALAEIGIQVRLKAIQGLKAQPRTVELWLAAPKARTEKVSETDSNKVKQDGTSPQKKKPDKPESKS